MYIKKSNKVYLLKRQVTWWCNKTLLPKDNGENSENGRKWNNLAGHSRVLLLSVAPDTHLSLQAANNTLKSPAKLQIWHTMKPYAL